MADTRRELSALQTLLADNSSGAITAQSARDVLISESPSYVIPTSAFASPPSTPVTGDLWLPSDGISAYRYSGSAWVPWGPVFPFTEPTLQTFAWVNQGSSTIATTNGGIFLSMPSTAGVNAVIRKKSAPSTPYTITAHVLPLLSPASIPVCGLCFRESSSGKIHMFNLYNIVTGSGYNAGLGSSKYTSATAFSADYTSLNPFPMPANSGVFLRIEDDGTNRKTHYSTDGRNFRQFTTVGRTDFLTADEVGFCVGTVSGTVAAAMMLSSWKEG